MTVVAHPTKDGAVEIPLTAPPRLHQSRACPSFRKVPKSLSTTELTDRKTKAQGGKMTYPRVSMQKRDEAGTRTQVSKSQPRAPFLYTNGFMKPKSALTLPHSHMHTEYLKICTRELTVVLSGRSSWSGKSGGELLLFTLIPSVLLDFIFVLFCFCHERFIYSYYKNKSATKGDSGPSPLPTHT